jgi:PKD repeat protein
MRSIRYNLIIPLAISFLVFNSPAFAENKSHRSGVASDQPITSSRCNIFTFDATGSYDPDNQDISIIWTFGDGHQSSEPVVTHTFEKAGKYPVALCITDDSTQTCNTSSVVQLVEAGIPPAVSFTSPDTACVNEEILFDSSESASVSNQKLNFQWNFGDSTTAKTSNPKVIKTYTQSGRYQVLLTASDGSNAVCSSGEIAKDLLINTPPMADAGPEVIQRCIQEGNNAAIDFDATASKNPNENNLIYHWDFGDGNQAEGKKVSHTYSSLSYYDVKLIVRDPSVLNCNTGVDFISVKIDKAPQANAGEEIAACSGDVIDFDGSNSYVEKKGTLSASWDFADGHFSKNLKTTHRYDRPGTYETKLTVKSDLNPTCAPSTNTRKVYINSIPQVVLKTATAGCVGNLISFDASDSVDPDGDTIDFYWSFGDGHILKGGPLVTHQYTQGGTYTVTLIVDDMKGTSCSTVTTNRTIKINSAPVANAGRKEPCCTNENSEFDASTSMDPDGDKLTYFWEFGDGTQEKGAKVTHTYTQGGTYQITLMVDDNSKTSCSQTMDTYTVSVNAKPVAVMNIK